MERARPLRLLSLDGGGVRGLSSLLILERMMEYIKQENNLPATPRPCDYFDMIAGTSTGGLIAIMLGRLQMDVDSCIKVYCDLAEKVFPEDKRLLASKRKKADAILGKPWFDARNLEVALKTVVEEKLGNSAATMVDPADPSPKCKVFVCAIYEKQVTPVIFRTYASKHAARATRDAAIWEAGRATTAAPIFFAPMSIGDFDGTFADGGLVMNNPIQELKLEARRVWPNLQTHPWSVFVSIGTGDQAPRDLGPGLAPLVEALSSIATDARRKAIEFATNNPELAQERLFRFNVQVGLNDVGMERWQEKATIEAATERYLSEDPQVSSMLSKCIERLKESSIEQLQASEDERLQTRLENLRVSTSQQSIFSVPYQPVTTFSNRAELQQALETEMTRENHDILPPRIVPIKGLGGTGKTQLALKHVFDHRMAYDTILWIDASTTDTVKRSFHDFAAEHIPESDPSRGSLKEALGYPVVPWLVSRRGEWLVVMDNADDIDIRKLKNMFVSSKKGHIIITTRQKDLGRITAIKGITVGAMTEDEAIRLFMTAANLDNISTNQQTIAKDIVKELEYLALAVDLAGSYVKNSPSVQTNLGRYLKLFAAKRTQLLATPPAQAFGDYELSLATVWESSYDAVQHNSVLAASLLTFLGFLDGRDLQPNIWASYSFYAAYRRKYETSERWPVGPLEESVGSEIFEAELETNTNDDDDLWVGKPAFEQAMGTISALHLVRYEPTTERYSMHSLVHKWARDRLPAQLKEVFIESAVQFLGYGIPSPPKHVFERHYEGHIVECASYVKTGNFHKRQEMALTLIAEYCVRRRLWDAHGVYISCLSFGGDDLVQLEQQAASLCRTGQRREAEKIQRRILSRRLLDPPQNDELHTAQYFLGNNLTSLEEYEEGETLLQSAMQGFEDIHGRQYLWFVIACRALANNFTKTRRFEKAHEILKIAVQSVQSSETISELDGLMAMKEYAFSCFDTGNVAEAENVLIFVLRRRTELLDPRHPDLVATKHGLAWLYNESGRRAQAEAVVRWGLNAIDNPMFFNMQRLGGLDSNVLPETAKSSPASEPAQLKPRTQQTPRHLISPPLLIRLLAARREGGLG